MILHDSFVKYHRSSLLNMNYCSDGKVCVCVCVCIKESWEEIVIAARQSYIKIWMQVFCWVRLKKSAICFHGIPGHDVLKFPRILWRRYKSVVFVQPRTLRYSDWVENLRMLASQKPRSVFHSLLSHLFYFFLLLSK